MNNHSTNLIGKSVGLEALKAVGKDSTNIKILSAKSNKGLWVWNIQSKAVQSEQILLVGLEKEDPKALFFFLVPSEVAGSRKTIAYKDGSKTWLEPYRLLNGSTESGETEGS